MPHRCIIKVLTLIDRICVQSARALYDNPAAHNVRQMSKVNAEQRRQSLRIEQDLDFIYDGRVICQVSKIT